MYNKLNISENTLFTLSLFSGGFNKEYHVREIQRILGIGLGTVQFSLRALEKRTVLRSKKIGRSRVYFINKTEISRFYFVMAEAYKTTAFLAGKGLLREVIEAINPYIGEIGLIFGSYAKGLEKEGSDLDVFAVGEYAKDEINKIGKQYNLDISVKSYPPKVFYEYMRKDVLITEVLDNHLAFKGIDRFVNAVFDYG